MKTIDTKKVNIPWYLSPITVHNWNKMETTIGFIPAIKAWAMYVWFLFPNWWWSYTMEDCVNYIPDYVQKDGKMGTKLKTLFGYVLLLDEGGMIHYKWWKHIKKYDKDN